MNIFLKTQMGVLALLLVVVFISSSFGQESRQTCLAKFKPGKNGFVLNVEDSVREGAQLLSAPALAGSKEDCIEACCRDPSCNVASMELGDEEGGIKSCDLFDCLHKAKYVCHFVRKDGYQSYLRGNVFDLHDKAQPSPSGPVNPPRANAGLNLVVQPLESVTLSGMRSTGGIVSYEWKIESPYPYAVWTKGTFPDEMHVSNLTSGTYKFRLTVKDADGQSDSATTTVLVLTPEQSEHHCMAPKKTGPCRGAFPRWHYNAASLACEEFKFGGCMENKNNYVTENDCKVACSNQGKSGRTLTTPQDTNEKCGAPCTAEQFTCANGCCLNKNLQCDETPQCSDKSDEGSHCSRLEDRLQRMLEIQLDARKERCTMAVDTGNCRESHTMWYYKPEKRLCYRFNFGGCANGENENRFDTKEACEQFCSQVTETDVFYPGTRAEKLQNNIDTSMIIAIILGIAILALLIVLGFCFMRRRKNTHQPLPTHSNVYHNTTKPN